ncbi:signal transduction histidine kinase [Sphingomonas zeicaulis]|uniref:sensor histidine kinase n=1 Tax=Sphingomonas zeicaulis TaxID=1632740 RepID=UPI003D25179F
MGGMTAEVAAVIGAVMALWLGLAAWAMFSGMRMRARARSAASQADRLKLLLDSAPALPLVVRADGRVEAPERLADWLGLPQLPTFIGDIAGEEVGLSADDADLLVKDISAAQRSAGSFVRTVRAQGSTRTLMIRGAAAGTGLSAAGGVILWFFDATESETEIGRLGREAARLASAFDALSALIDTAPMPMWHRGEGLGLTLVNQAYVRAVEGGSVAAVVERGIELVDSGAELSPTATAATARDENRTIVRTAPATINGERRMLRIVDVPLGDLGVAGYAIDIEDEEQARGAMRRFAATQRDMLDRLSGGVAQFGPDRALVFSNQPFRRMFNMKSEWLADAPEFDRVLERMREGGRLPEVRDFPGWKAERRDWFRAADGAIEENWLLPAGAHMRVVGHPLPDGGLLLIFEDRTEQIQLASARDTLLRVRAATFDNLFEGVAVFAADGRLQMWNNRFRSIWGFDERLLDAHPRIDQLAEVAGQALANPSRAGLIRELVRVATVERGQRSGRVAFADGRHFDFAAVPLPDGNALFTMLDISDSRRIEQALRDKNEALEAAGKDSAGFMGNMSYELRTPVTAIAGFAEMLAGGFAGDLPEAAEPYVVSIRSEVARLSTLIDNMLDLSQRGAGGIAIEKTVFDLATTMNAVAETLDMSARARAIDLAVQTEESLGSIEGDDRRIRQALDHLVRLAIAGMPEGGRVLLHGDGTVAGARLIVSDDGPGMDEAAQARAFERPIEGDVGGEGQPASALLIARDIVEAHGGTLNLVSEPGEGTMITIVLPRR